MGSALAALFATVILVAVPGAAQPFTAPKLLVGTAGPAIIVLWSLATRRLRWRVPASLATALAVFASAMGIAAARGGPELFPQFAFLLSGPLVLIMILALDESDVRRPARALVWATIVVAVMAVVQRAGFDPWRLVGWSPSVEYPSPRMRAYATLGNPNFVASVLAGALPWTFAVTRGVTVRALATCMLLGGVLATGSRAGLVAAGVALAYLAWRSLGGRQRGGWRALVLTAGAVAIAVGLAVAVSERGVRESIAGRLLPVRVAWPHALEHPIFGLGLGAVARHYAAWQATFFTDATRATLARFADDFDHLHHEPLEWFLEIGSAGILAWIAVVVLALRAGTDREEAIIAGASATRIAAHAALAAVAIVGLADFPLHRPADYLAAWLALAVAARPTARAAPSPSSSSRVGRRTPAAR